MIDLAEGHRLGALIGTRLLGVYVERRRESSSIGRSYFYRRLRYVDASRRTPGLRRGPVADATDTPNGMNSGDGLPPGQILLLDDLDEFHAAASACAVEPPAVEPPHGAPAEWAPWPRLPRRRVSHTNFMGRYLKKSCVDP